MLKKVILIIIAVIFPLLAGELVVGKFFHQQTFSESVSSSIDCYDSHPDIPFTLAKNHTCRMLNISGEFNTTASLNSNGYRGGKFSMEKGASKRILALGDSMTFGWGVSDSQTYPFKLENILKENGDIEVINAGYKGGLSLDGFYIYLKNEGLKLKPDLVAVNFFVFNDIEDLAANVWTKTDEAGLPLKIESCCHAVDAHILRNKVLPFKYSIPVLRESQIYLLLVNTLKDRFRILTEKPLLATKGEEYLGCSLNPQCREKFVPEEDKAIKLISEMKKMTETSGAKFVMILLPVDYQIYPEAVDKYARYGMKWRLVAGNEDFAQKRIGELLKQNGIEFIDLLPVFIEKKNEDYPFFYIDAHFNSKGTAIVAEALAEYIKGIL